MFNRTRTKIKYVRGESENSTNPILGAVQSFFSKSKFDTRLLYVSAGLFFFGLLMVYSASASALKSCYDKDPFYYLERQIIWIIGGIVLAYISYRIPLKLLSDNAAMIMLVGLVGLVAVLIFGTEINDAKRWIYISEFSFQPSELAKLCFVIYLAAWLSRARPKIKNLQNAIREHFYGELLPFVLLIGVISLLVLFQPDLDTAVIITITALAIYYVSGKDYIHSIGAIFIIVFGALVGSVVTISAGYRLKRIQVWLDLIQGSLTLSQKRNEAFQVWNGLLAIANGGIFGVGYGSSTQKLCYLQETAWTDSIFAVIAEEFGLLGSLILIVTFLYFLSLGIGIANRASNRFSALLAIGITTWIVVQALLNIGANLALFPFGGIPLPFISYGGSSVMVVMVGVGLLLNISRHGKK